MNTCRCCSLGLVSSHQARLRAQECSQKLHLLRQSLEKRLQENNREDRQPPAGGTDGSEEPPSPRSSTPRCPLPASPSLLSLRPASLTGVYPLHFHTDNGSKSFPVKKSQGGRFPVLFYKKGAVSLVSRGSERVIRRFWTVLPKSRPSPRDVKPI